MFKKQFSVPAKQTSITSEQILHDIEAIRKASHHEIESNSLKLFEEKHEKLITDLKQFNNISHNLVGALDDGGDLRDQLQLLEKDLQKVSNKIKKQTEDKVLYN